MLYSVLVSLKNRLFSVRLRWWIFLFGSLVSIGLSLILDPDAGLIGKLQHGALFLTYLTGQSKAVLVVFLAWGLMKALFDFVRKEELLGVAKQSPEGAGLYFIGMSIHFAATIAASIAALFAF